MKRWDFPSQFLRMSCRIGLMGLLSGWLAGCMRDAPPDIPAFAPPASITLVESTVPAPPDDAPLPQAVTPAPKRVAQINAKQAPAIKPQAVATPAPKAEPAAPSLVGAWQVVEMSHQGQSMPMPGGMRMILAFEAGGAMSMEVSNPAGPQPPTQQGTYSLSNGQITMSVGKEAKTGTCVFEGTNRVTLDFTEVKMVLART